MTSIAHTGGDGRPEFDFADEEDGGDGRVFGITKEIDAIARTRLELSPRQDPMPAPDQTDTTVVVDQGDAPGDGGGPSIAAGG